MLSASAGTLPKGPQSTAPGAAVKANGAATSSSSKAALGSSTSPKPVPPPSPPTGTAARPMSGLFGWVMDCLRPGSLRSYDAWKRPTSARPSTLQGGQTTGTIPKRPSTSGLTESSTATKNVMGSSRAATAAALPGPSRPSTSTPTGFPKQHQSSPLATKYGTGDVRTRLALLEVRGYKYDYLDR